MITNQTKKHKVIITPSDDRFNDNRYPIINITGRCNRFTKQNIEYYNSVKYYSHENYRTPVYFVCPTPENKKYQTSNVIDFGI